MPTANRVSAAGAQRQVDLVDGSGVRRFAWLLFVMAAFAALAAHTAPSRDLAIRGGAEHAAIRALVGDIAGASSR